MWDVIVQNSGSIVPISPCAQDLQDGDLHTFGHLPLRRHAFVLFEFPRQVSRYPKGPFPLNLSCIMQGFHMNRYGAPTPPNPPIRNERRSNQQCGAVAGGALVDHDMTVQWTEA